MPAPSRTPVSRRTTLVVGAVGAIGVVVLTSGCDLDPRAEPGPPAPTTGAPTDPAADADLVLLDDVRAGVGTALALVEATRRRHPTLRPLLRPLALAHRAHDAVLADAGRGSDGAQDPAPPVRGDPGRALSALRGRETRLQRDLSDAAVQAGSGGFARVLASMSASVAQHLTLLPEGPQA